MVKGNTGFIPHTTADVTEMLADIGVDSIEQLFDEIPEELLLQQELNLPDADDEMTITQRMRAVAQASPALKCFAGAGAYDHFIPAAVWDIVGRGEFYTAYTPYQAEASQGGLQVIYEYQTMIARLTAMDVANASVYDGATALAESLLMAVRENRKAEKVVLIAGNLHPHYREVVETILSRQAIEIIELAYDQKTGLIDQTQLAQYEAKNYAALAIQQPNFFGCLEQVDELTNWAQQQNMLVIATVNPISLALLKPPGEWGERGVDIVCGEGQPLGVPLASGGPYFGFMTCRQQLVRQLPGRIVGRTVDADGKPGFCLTLQAREQHIRRGKAKSNICTNQGLLVTAATIHMSLLGDQGLQRVAQNCHSNTLALMDGLAEIDGLEFIFPKSCFHEFAVRLPIPAQVFIESMLKHGILAGYDLEATYPDLGHALLVCVTETKTESDIHAYIEAFQQVWQEVQCYADI